MSLHPRITIVPKVCHGKPCMRGLRYRIELVLELLARGPSEQEVLADYPDLARDDLLAALAFAANAIRGSRFEPFAAE